jgi:Planctomycete cytochrome C
MRIGLAKLALLVTACAGEDDRPATWSYISTAIVQPNCATAGCHSALAATGGVQLHTRVAGYTTLVGSNADPEARNFVVPGQPDQSKLMYLLRGEEIWRMPPDGQLPQADLDLIERWILEGAKDD